MDGIVMRILVSLHVYLITFWYHESWSLSDVMLMVCRMWREIRLLAASKPVIASMADVAASGGYYMAMGAQAIVAESLTLTGSIGVVTGKPRCFTFSLGEKRRACGYDNISETKNIDLLIT